MVGHNPGLEDLVPLLTGTAAPMPTSAIAVLALPGAWSDAGRATATLVTAGRPPEA
jgi:phosphohistidine phosphatase